MTGDREKVMWDKMTDLQEQKRSQTLSFRFESRSDDTTAYVTGIMVTGSDGGEGAYKMRPSGMDEDGEPLYHWMREDGTRAAEWLDDALCIAVSEWNTRGEEIQRAERAAGWDPNP